MAQEYHKAVLILIIAFAFVSGEFDSSKEAWRVRSRRGVVKQVANLLSKGAKYPATLRRFWQARSVLVKDATMYAKSPIIVKYRKQGGTERAFSDFNMLKPYKQFHGEFTETDNIVKAADIGGYTVLLRRCLNLDGHTPQYCIQMSRTAQFEGIQRGPVIHVDYV